MKYSTLILLVFPICLLQNCGDIENSNALESTKTIEIQKDFLFGDSPELQFEMLDTINLEARGNPPLTWIQDVAFSENFFLLLDIKHGLLKFDNDGNFLQKIGEKGEGPEEYIMPYAIHLDEKENIALVADWQKRVVISYDLERNFISSSQRLPGYPISFYDDNDSLLLVQETLNGTNEKPRQVLISSIAPNTLEVKNWEKPLFGFNSKFTSIHSIPRFLSRVKNASLFYFPVIRGDISSHSDMDTIFKKQDDHLIPEYLLHFTGFDNSKQLRIVQMVLANNYIFLRVVYEKSSYFVAIDLENNHTLVHLRKLFDRTLSEEIIPRPLSGNLFYSILRYKESSGENSEEKNPLIVLYRLLN